MRGRFTGAALLALLACCGPARAQAFDAELDARLAPVARLAFNHPEAGLQVLERLQKEKHGGGAESDHWQFELARARLLLAAGEVRQAQELAEKLARRAEDHAKLLRAEIAERGAQGDLAAELAQQSLQGLERGCSRSQPAESVARGGCDFRATWAALRILQRHQINRGELAFANNSNSFALALAQAGHDNLLSVISLGDLALVEQLQDQADGVRRHITLALQTAQGDAQAMGRVKVYEAALAARRREPAVQLKLLEEALRYATEADATRDVAQVQGNLVDSYMHQGEPAKAVAMARLALPVITRFRDLRLERTLRHNLSVALVLLKQFDAARQEIARVDVLRQSQTDGAQRVTELRELGQAYADAGQAKEAIRLYHEERQLSAEVAARNREASLQQLRLKYDSEGKQRDLQLLARENAIKEQQLVNRNRASQVGVALAVLLGLSMLLVGWMLLRVRDANRKLKAKQALLRAQSERDPLTELANRRHFLGVMAQQEADRFEGALLMVDIDHFKHVNDQHGHAAGDIVICEVARRITQAVRNEDLVVRWGGEEFLVFAPGVPQSQLPQLAERILFGVGSTPVQVESGPLQVSVSIGYAHFPLPPSKLKLHWEQAVNWADMALYTAKAQGRNRAVGIVTVLAQDSDALLQIEADFDAACSSERVSLQQVAGPPRWQHSSQFFGQ